MNNQVTVFGANGRVGSLVVAELLLRGYAVVAFVHNTHQLPANDQLQIVQGDIYNMQDVDRAIRGSSAVISALGSWGTPKKNILTAGMTNIINGMQRQSISKIVSLTGADARASGDVLSVVHRVMHLGLTIVAGRVLHDGERHIELLHQSNLDWSVVRSPIMSSDRTDDEQYVLSSSRPLPWQTIPRRLVVLALADLLHDTTWQQKSPYISVRG
jgi:putative NADH-flavin reductase